MALKLLETTANSFKDAVQFTEVILEDRNWSILTSVYIPLKTAHLTISIQYLLHITVTGTIERIFKEDFNWNICLCRLSYIEEKETLKTGRGLPIEDRARKPQLIFCW